MTEAAAIYALWTKAQETYAQARACDDPLKKKKLLNVADDYLRQADELRGCQIIQAVFPTSGRKFG